MHSLSKYDRIDSNLSSCFSIVNVFFDNLDYFKTSPPWNSYQDKDLLEKLLYIYDDIKDHYNYQIPFTKNFKWYINTSSCLFF